MSTITGDLEKEIKNSKDFVENQADPCNTLKSEETFPRSENYLILKELNSILLNCTNLTSRQKLEYCNSQRYFMKLFLKELNHR